MKPEIQTLRAEIAADLDAIAEIYAALEHPNLELADEDQRIVVAYHLHNLYNTFESIFQRIARLPIRGNRVDDQAGWHADLLARMRLDVEGLRPRVISNATYDCLDELRRFRHLFRSGYRLHLDPERLAVVRNKARRLEGLYRADLERFMAFLAELAQA